MLTEASGEAAETAAALLVLCCRLALAAALLALPPSPLLDRAVNKVQPLLTFHAKSYVMLEIILFNNLHCEIMLTTIIPGGSLEIMCSTSTTWLFALVLVFTNLS